MQPVTGIIYFLIKVYLFCAMIILIYSLLADGIMNEEGYNYYLTTAIPVLLIQLT